MLDHALAHELFYAIAACLLLAIGTVVQLKRTSDEPRRAGAPDGLTMDLGIAGRRALVCAASKGLGRGCAQALADAGCDVTIVARNAELLRRTAEEIGARAGRPVAFVAADITTSGRPRRRARDVPRARHPGQQRRRDRRPAISATGTATRGCARSMRTC